MKRVRHIIEAALMRWLLAAFRALPLDVASTAGGYIARAIGVCFSMQKTARHNLAIALPDLSDARRYEILSGMWDNIGRVAAEMAHLPGNTLIDRITLHGEENLPKPGEHVLFFSAHLGNWEVLPSIPHRRGTGITLIYRHANNPYADALLANIRRTHSDNMIAKGPRGAFKLAKALKNKESLCMLVDQKMNDGIAVPFFGRPAMTAPAIAKLALHYSLPIIPARVVRRNGAHFDVHILPPLTYDKTGDQQKDILAIMTKINAILEEWIREHPEQWFWVHKRWPVIKV